MGPALASKATDVAHFDLDQLENEIANLAMHISTVMCRWLLLVAEYDRRRGGRAWGCRGTANWLAWRCGIGDRAAREHVRVARRLPELPLVTAAFARGELSYSKVRAITRAATPDSEQELVDLALGSTARRLDAIVRGMRTAPSAQLEVANAGHNRRFLEWRWEEDGSLSFRGRLGADDGAALIEAIEIGAEALHPVVEAVVHPLAEAGSKSPDLVASGVGPDGPLGGGDAVPGRVVPLGARRADALAEILHSGAPPAQVVLHVDAPALAGADHDGDTCALEDGPAVPAETARRLACDAELVPAHPLRSGGVDFGRKRRVVSPALRSALERRDRGCRFPGCDRRHGLHAHHIHHWAHGGRTDRDNLVLVCRFHHRLLHEGGFTAQRFRGTTRFKRPDGRAVPEVPGPGAGRMPTIACDEPRLGAAPVRHVPDAHEASPPFDNRDSTGQRGARRVARHAGGGAAGSW